MDESVALWHLAVGVVAIIVAVVAAAASSVWAVTGRIDKKTAEVRSEFTLAMREHKAENDAAHKSIRAEIAEVGNRVTLMGEDVAELKEAKEENVRAHESLRAEYVRAHESLCAENVRAHESLRAEFVSAHESLHAENERAHESLSAQIAEVGGRVNLTREDLSELRGELRGARYAFERRRESEQEPAGMAD